MSWSFLKTSIQQGELKKPDIWTMYNGMVPKRYKVIAFLTFVLAVLFYLFWQICKQQPALAQVATFTEDPYDAVGSVGTQFAVFTALLTMIRAFRPYQPDNVGHGQQLLMARGAYLACLAVAVTLGADIVAMLRYPSHVRWAEYLSFSQPMPGDCRDICMAQGKITRIRN